MSVVQATCGYGCGLNSKAFVDAYLDDEPDLWWVRRDSCDHFTRALLDVVDARVRPGDVVATITANYKYAHARSYDADFVLDLEARVHARGATLLLLGDGPYLKDFGFNCKTDATAADCDTPRQDAEPEFFRDVETFYENLADGHADTLFFPVFDLFCADDLCRAYIPGTDTVAVTDKGHWTTASSLYLAPFLHCFLQDAGILPLRDDRDDDPLRAC